MKSLEKFTIEDVDLLFIRSNEISEQEQESGLTEIAGATVHCQNCNTRWRLGAGGATITFTYGHVNLCCPNCGEQEFFPRSKITPPLNQS